MITKSVKPQGGLTTAMATFVFNASTTKINHLTYSNLIVPSNLIKQMISRVERLFKKLTTNIIPKLLHVKQLTKKIFNRIYS